MPLFLLGQLISGPKKTGPHNSYKSYLSNEPKTGLIGPEITKILHILNDTHIVLTVSSPILVCF